MATCVAATPALRFHSPADTLWAEAWLSSEGGEGSLTVQLRNHTLDTIEMSFIDDTYIAQLRDGSVEALEKADFYQYPTRLPTGEQAAIRLRLPKTRPARDMTALVIRLEQGRRVLALNPAQAPAAAPDLPPSAPVVPATEPVPTMVMPPPAPVPAEAAPAPTIVEPPVPAPEPPATAPVAAPAPTPAPEPVAATPAPAEWLELPSAEVPVVVEFSQEFGGSLTLHVAWDENGPASRVYPEERQVFRVAPGPHVCTLRSEVQGLTPVTTEIPLVIGEEPVRLIVRGSVTLDGVTLHVEAWNNVTNDLLLERTIQPAP